MDVLDFKLNFDLLNHKIHKLNNLVEVIGIATRPERSMVERPVFKEFHPTGRFITNEGKKWKDIKDGRLNTNETGSTYFRTNERQETNETNPY